jgi:threonine/homoserine/homoserine lactone efflux protein
VLAFVCNTTRQASTVGGFFYARLISSDHAGFFIRLKVCKEQMMEFGMFVRGLVIGLAIAAPVGPIGVLVIRRTLAEGRLMGFVTGMGAASADGLFGFVGALGLTVVSTLLLSGEWWLRLLGGLFLCYLGVTTFLAAPGERAANVERGSYIRAYLSTFLLTLTNPLTILSFAAVFAGLGLGVVTGNAGSAMLVVTGVFMGSALWWLLLCGGVSLLRARVTPRALRWINYLSGSVIVGFGLFALLSLL